MNQDINKILFTLIYLLVLFGICSGMMYATSSNSNIIGESSSNNIIDSSIENENNAALLIAFTGIVLTLLLGFTYYLTKDNFEKEQEINKQKSIK
jgi:phosphotransferase system  glucose/maltose/N-acetylglucosamine-specific IIC component